MTKNHAIQCDSQFQQYRLVGKLFRVLNFTLNRLNRSKIVLNFSIARFCLRPGCTYNWVGSYMTKFWKILKNAVLKKKTAKREGNSLSKPSNVIHTKSENTLERNPIFVFSSLYPSPHTTVLHVLHIFFVSYYWRFCWLVVLGILRDFGIFLYLLSLLFAATFILIWALFSLGEEWVT